MNKKTERMIDIFLYISVPVALIVGCVGPAERKVKNVPSDYKVQHNFKKTNLTGKLESVTLLEQGETNLIIQAQVKDKNIADRVVTNHSSLFAMQHSSNENHNNKIHRKSDSDLTANANEDERRLLPPSQNIYYFDSEKCEIANSDYEQLKNHAEFLKNNPNLMITIGGYTDQSGTAEYNEKLSQRRAKAVASLLIEFGAQESQLMVVGYGASVNFQPGTDILTTRRVELEYSDVVTVSSL